MSLVAVNVCAERLEGAVVIWLAFSQPDGQVFALTLDPPAAAALQDALANAQEQAEILAQPLVQAQARILDSALCVVCGERPGRPHYGGKCAACWDPEDPAAYS